MKKIGVVGSRRRSVYSDYTKVREAMINQYIEGDYFVSGGCKEGADSFAEIVARELGATIVIHHADWKKQGKKAGVIRNTRIAEDSDILIACVSEDRSGGTEDTLSKYLKLGKDQLVLV